MLRKHLLLTIVASLLLLTPIHCYDKCVHDKNKHPEPIVMDPETDNLDSEGRLLADVTAYPKMRIQPYFGAMGNDTAFNSYVKNYLIPPIVDYFEHALATRYPLGSTFKMGTAGVCGIPTPDELKTGVAADMFWIIADGYDQGNSWLADSWACFLMSGSKRPYISKTTFNRWDFTTTKDVLVHEKNIVCTMHEFIHNLGFSSSLYGGYLDPNGVKLTGHITTVNYFGYNSTVLNVEPLTSRLRSHFGCNTLKGAYMENTGGAGTVGSHFERRIFANEVMTSGMIYDQVVSEFTLAILEGSGWYVPDYKYAEVLPFGQGQGCSFITGNCDPNKYQEWCAGTVRGCTSQGSGGTCAADWRSDNCRFQHPAYNYHCENANGVKYARFPSQEAYGRGIGSKCFEGTLATTAASATANSMCLKYQCKANTARLLGSSTSTRTSSRTINHIDGTKTYVITKNATTTYTNGTIISTITVNTTDVSLTGVSTTKITVTATCLVGCPSGSTSSGTGSTGSTTNNTSTSGSTDSGSTGSTGSTDSGTTSGSTGSTETTGSTVGSYTLILQFGSTSVTCAKAGQVSVAGYSGTITCPDPLEFCSTLGSGKCPRNCMGRGSCISGKCQCQTGFSGTDCSLGPNGQFY